MVYKPHLLLLLLLLLLQCSLIIASVRDTGDVSDDDDIANELNGTPLENAEHLLDKYILPYLRRHGDYNQTGRLDLTTLRICRCDVHWGCDQVTRGYTPRILEHIVSKEISSRWKATCVTDGLCAQMLGERSKQPVYGCIDKAYTNSGVAEEMGIQSARCHNGSAPMEIVEHLWVCCDTRSYCANQTALVPQLFESYGKNETSLSSKRRNKNKNAKIDANTKKSSDAELLTWQIVAILLISANVLVCVIFCVSVRFGSHIISLLRDSWRDRGDNATAADAAATQLLNVPPTASAPVHFKADETGGRVAVKGAATKGADEVSQKSQEQNSAASQVKAHPAMRLFADLESTMGTSGYGPAQLQPRSMKHTVQKGKIIGEGRYGAVYHGTYNNEEVAIKAFYAADEMSYNTEVRVYQLGTLRHPNVLRYIANDRIDNGTMIEMWLLTEYYALGSLYDFLQTHTLDIRMCYDMIRSTANGLSFLHHEHSSSSALTKPAIVHRDIKTRNILVNNDMTCAIADFGLAMIAATNDDDDATVSERSREESEVGRRFGTTRYLAPEILNETMGPNRFEAFRMADIYSFTLCCWEIMVRTSDEEIVAVEPDASIPYGDKVQRDPTWEEMRELVAIQCVRPPPNPLWLTSPNFSRLYEIVRGSWVSAPSARLTAHNIRSRIEHIQAEVVRERANAARQSVEHQQQQQQPQPKNADETPLLPKETAQPATKND